MGSISSKDIIDEMLANNGTFPGDPQALQISEYTNQWGGQTYHVAFDQNDLHALYNSPFCKNIIALWKRPQIPLHTPETQ